MAQSSSFNGDIRAQASLDAMRKSAHGLQQTLDLGTKAGTLTAAEQQLMVASIVATLKAVEVGQAVLDDDLDDEDEDLDDLLPWMEESDATDITMK
ncbi:hypothetical protein MBLNU457_6603t1 [Dothideomycetes sp. NU457]